MTAFTLPEAELIGTFLETLGFGAYCLIFFDCLKVLRQRHIERKPVGYLFFTSIIIFSLVVIHVVVDLIRVKIAFVDNQSIANGALAHYSNINNLKSLLKTSAYISVTIVSDAFIIYRTYIVWGKRWVVIVLPVALFIVDTAMSIWSTWSISVVKPGQSILVADVTLRVKYFFTFTLALNMLCTIMIAYKIWTIQRAVSGYSKNKADSSRLSGVMTIIIESAAIYSGCLIVMIVTSAIGHPSMFLVMNATSPIIGIVFCSIINRVSMGVSADNAGGSRRPHTGSAGMGGTTYASTHYAQHNYGEGVQISLQKVVHRDSDPDSSEMKLPVDERV